jgi:hypothetical protein
MTAETAGSSVCHTLEVAMKELTGVVMSEYEIELVSKKDHSAVGEANDLESALLGCCNTGLPAWSHSGPARNHRRL